MIYGQQSGQQAGSVWGIAMSAAMGNGIVPRSADEPRVRATTRWPWTRARDTDHESAAALRA